MSDIQIPHNQVNVQILTQTTPSAPAESEEVAWILFAKADVLCSDWIQDSALTASMLKKPSLKDADGMLQTYFTDQDKLIYVNCVQLGDEKRGDDKIIQSAQSTAKAALKAQTQRIIVDAHNIPLTADQKALWIRYFAQAIIERANPLPVLKEKQTEQFLKQMDIHVADNEQSSAEEMVKMGSAIADGVNFARLLGDLPGNICKPSFLADKAREWAAQDGVENISVDIKGNQDIQDLKMGAFWGVAKGSVEEAQLITMNYQGGAADDAPIVFVGKGLTFDAGGISIKPAASMDEMKYDMCGAAAVFGLMSVVAKLQLPLNVMGIIGSCENMPDAAATKPGDVLTSMSGKTIEVLNTDAEGRLVLCDVLHYAKQFKPKAVIDLATLTGAIIIGLGRVPSGLFSNDDDLAQALTQAGEATQDRVWRLPIWEDYQKQLKSNFADLANIGGRDAGSITAACFLANFTEGEKWAHLDIAGTAWNTGANKGATGRPVPTLVEYLLQQLNQ